MASFMPTLPGAPFVFTPRFLLNGQDYRRAILFDDIAGKVKAINQTKPKADIRMQLARSGTLLDTQVEASVDEANQHRAEIYLAIYENDLTTAVSAGENRGRTLKHEFVVRALAGPLMPGA